MFILIDIFQEQAKLVTKQILVDDANDVREIYICFDKRSFYYINKYCIIVMIVVSEKCKSKENVTNYQYL